MHVLVGMDCVVMLGGHARGSFRVMPGGSGRGVVQGSGRGVVQGSCRGFVQGVQP